jgi:hypothetical protein
VAPLTRWNCGLSKLLALLLSACVVLLTLALPSSSAVAQYPPVTITGPNDETTDDQTIPVDYAAFVFAITEAFDVSWECSLTGTTSRGPAGCTPGESMRYDELPDGGYTFSVTPVGGAVASTRTFTVDASISSGSSPTVGITSTPSAKTHTRTATFKFVSDPSDAPLRCWLDSRAPTNCHAEQSYGKRHPLGRGSHTFVVSAVGGSADSWTWTIKPKMQTNDTTTSSFPIPPVAGGGGGFLLLTATGILLYSRHRFHVRLELKAEDEAPHGPCHGDGWRCKKELTLTPARRHITYLPASATDAEGNEVARNFEGQVVDRLNDAVARYRRAPDDVEGLRAALLPVASSLVADFDVWLYDLPRVSRRIVLKAHLEGGKMETAFTPYRCEHGEWKPHKSWSHEFADERDEDVAATAHPLGDLSALVAYLASFVAQVDVQAERTPTARAVPYA